MRTKSEENWTVGTQCLDTGSLNAAASRLYYAVFQAVLGFAVAKQGYVYKVGAHRDMAHLVRSQGKGREHYGDAFEDLMELRIKADYLPVTPSEGEIMSLLADASAIRRFYLNKAEN